MHLAATVAEDEGAAVWRIVLNDITAHKRTEEDLQRVRERFELAVAGSADGLWDWDFTTNTVFYSPRFLEMLGFMPDDPRFPPVYESFKKRLHPDDTRLIEDALQHAVIDGAPYRAIHRIQTESGAWRWFEARGPPSGTSTTSPRE
jgi:PAS domain-containing protein